MKMLTEQRLRELLERAYDKAIDNKTSVIYGAFVGDPLNAELLRAECIDNLIYISDRDEVAQQGADAFSYAVTKPVWVGVDLGVSAAIELAAVQAPAPGEPTELEQRKRDYARALDAIKGHVEYISLLEQKLRELQSFKDGVELHQRGGSNSWYWLDDRENYLETMVASLPVVIRAEQLRELLTASQAPAVGAGYKLLEDGKTMIPADWTPLRLEWEAGYPEDVACGPVRAMERLKRWLDAYFVLIQQRMAPAAGLSLTQEPKYTVNGHAIVNRASGAEIPADEPVFILRASDKRAASIIGEYAEMCNDPVHAQIVSDRFCEFGDWADAHPERMKEPDTAPANFDVPVQAKGKLPAALEGAPIVQAIRVWIESHKARHGGASPTDDEVIEAAHQDPPFSQPL